MSIHKEFAFCYCGIRRIMCVFLFCFALTASSGASEEFQLDMNQGSVTEMNEQKSLNIGKRFPDVSGETLAGEKKIIPDSSAGKVTLVTVAFLRENQGQLDSWLNPFAETFGNREGFMFYEVPMISSGYRFISFIIDRGMKAGLPRSKHDHVVTMYGDVESYSSKLQIDPRYGHAFLLDKEGIIRWQAQGYSTPETRQAMLKTAEQLAK